MVHHVIVGLFHCLIFAAPYRHDAYARRSAVWEKFGGLELSQEDKMMSTESNHTLRRPPMKRLLGRKTGLVATRDPVTAGRLVIVSHRVPVPRANGSLPPGGLASGLSDAVAATPTLWFGTSGAGFKGKTTTLLTENDPHVVKTVTYSTLSLHNRLLKPYYEGFANAYLWPLFHSLYDKVLYDSGWHRAYNKVNEELANRLVDKLRLDDTLWIHDYHLIPLGALLRPKLAESRLASLKLGFFLHIPVPSKDAVFTEGVTCGDNLFGCEQLKDLFLKLSAYDLIGVHTKQDETNLKGIMTLLKNENSSIDMPKFRIETHPIGISPHEFKKEAKKTKVKANNWLRENIRKIVGNQDQPAFDLQSRYILAVDRLDYTKGIPERLRAVELMFRQHPELIGQVSYLQIAAPSRQDVQMYKDLSNEMNSIMQTMTHSWRGKAPGYYHYGSVDRSIVAALCESANVGVVTPLKDGMNLFAKEYVASQIDKSRKERGVLVLSQHAGAADELGLYTDDGALIVDPYNTQQTADAIYKALHMPTKMRADRSNKMAEAVKTVTATSWASKFIHSLNT